MDMGWHGFIGHGMLLLALFFLGLMCGDRLRRSRDCEGDDETS